MFDVAGSEFLVIFIVTLLVVGPRQLPELFHKIGRFSATLRRMTENFRRHLEEPFTEITPPDLSSDASPETSSPPSPAPQNNAAQ